MKFSVKVPLGVLSLDKYSNLRNIAFIAMLKEDAIKAGATYMDFTAENEFAVFESDSEQFAKDLKSTFDQVAAESLAKILHEMYSDAIKYESFSKMVSDKFRDVCTISETNE